MKQIPTWILTDLSKQQKERLPKEYQVVTGETIPEESLEEIEVIVGRPSMDVLKKAKNLKWLQLDTAGSEQYCIEGLLPKGGILTNATGCFGLTISEYLIGSILMLMRNMNFYVRNQMEGKWQVEGPIYSIYGSTFLIIGLGNLGLEFAKRIKALGGKTIGIKKHVDQPVEFIDELYTMDHIEELLPRADVVVMALPSTKETRGCFHKAYFECMKSSAIWANVGRGDVVNTQDVVDAVHDKRILGAVMDVCDIEPIPQDHPVWKEENIIITPHISGTFQLPKTKDIFVDILVENMMAYHNKEQMRNIVDVAEGYRSYELRKS